MKKVLIIEADASLAKKLQQSCEAQGHLTQTAADGYIGKKLASIPGFSSIIINTDLPLIDGISLCAALRKSCAKVPLIMLSADCSLSQKLKAFDAGADDIIAIPFEAAELMARIHVFHRWADHIRCPEEIITIADLEINCILQTVKRAGAEIPLTRLEYALLMALATDKGKPVSKKELLKKVWNINYDCTTNILEYTISGLRMKMDKGFPVQLIITMRGRGYMIRG
jgi:two-component system, OmpR family, copper resistance phosphate regulon response regulator CusR